MRILVIIVVFVAIAAVFFLGQERSRHADSYIAEAEKILGQPTVSDELSGFISQNREELIRLYGDGLCFEGNYQNAVEKLLLADGERGVYFAENREGVSYYFLLSCSDEFFAEFVREGGLDFSSLIAGVDPYFVLYFIKPARLALLPVRVHQARNRELQIGLMELTLIYACTEDRVKVLNNSGVRGNVAFLNKYGITISGLAKAHCPEALAWWS